MGAISTYQPDVLCADALLRPVAGQSNTYQALTRFVDMLVLTGPVFQALERIQFPFHAILGRGNHSCLRVVATGGALSFGSQRRFFAFHLKALCGGIFNF